MNPNAVTAATLAAAAAAACLLSACSQQPVRTDEVSGTSATEGIPRYIAHLQPMNSAVTGSDATATARFDIHADDVVISIDAEGLPPDIEHWQHFHGFADGRVAKCPTAAADVNGDGVIDLIETEPASGTTMVPFDTDPAAMDIAHGQYPFADGSGHFSYRQSVSIPALDAAFAKAFAGQKPELERRVIYIHGVMTDAALPSTVASLGPIPAHVTLPIACGVIERIGG